MQRWDSQAASFRNVDAPLELNVGAYGYGLGVSQIAASGNSIAHGGGLPGGSLMRWLPGTALDSCMGTSPASFGDMFNNALAALQPGHFSLGG
jgi:hypothetical protein